MLELLSGSGCEIKRGKAITLIKAGQKNIRLNSLGEGYTEADLRDAISGAKVHKPRKNRAVTAQKKARLISEIKEKLNGRHTSWDSVRILKQMAQSVLYVQQHDFENFDALAAKYASATARVGELSATVKSAEKRMTEIAALRTQIINYVKTRNVYAGYREAGYSKKYLAEHESDIIIHKAAKKASDELGLKKLPTVKSLNAEYAELLAQKKAAYAEYNTAKKEMRELLIHKANVEHILGLDNRTRQKSERGSVRKNSAGTVRSRRWNLRSKGFGGDATNKQNGSFPVSRKSPVFRICSTNALLASSPVPKYSCSYSTILAFAGTGVSMLVLDYAYDLPLLQVLNSNNIGIAVMQGLSGSFGVVLAVPATVILAVMAYTGQVKPTDVGDS